MAGSLLLLAVLPRWWSAGLGYMGLNALFAITTLAFTITSQELVSPAWRATMSGSTTMATGLSRAGMAFGGGYLITNFGFSTLFFVGAGLTLAGALLFWTYTWLPRLFLLRRAALKITPHPAQIR
jgi:predicted MFS family arabinose efflux permease